MPGVRTADEHRGGCAERPSDRIPVDQAPARLVGTAEEGVRGTAETEAATLGIHDELSAFGAGRSERLLGVDVLARGEGSPHQRSVRFGRREIEHELDLGIGDECIDRRRPQPVLRRERLRELLIEIGARDGLPPIERNRVLDVTRSDDSAADDADAHRRGHAPVIRRTARNERSTAVNGSSPTSSSSTTSHSAPAPRAAGSTCS